MYVAEACRPPPVGIPEPRRTSAASAVSSTRSRDPRYCLGRQGAGEQLRRRSAVPLGQPWRGGARRLPWRCGSGPLGGVHGREELGPTMATMAGRSWAQLKQRGRRSHGGSELGAARAKREEEPWRVGAQAEREEELGSLEGEF